MKIKYKMGYIKSNLGNYIRRVAVKLSSLQFIRGHLNEIQYLCLFIIIEKFSSK